jgi:hypothetical protein
MNCCATNELIIFSAALLLLCRKIRKAICIANALAKLLLKQLCWGKQLFLQKFLPRIFAQCAPKHQLGPLFLQCPNFCMFKNWFMKLIKLTFYP